MRTLDLTKRYGHTTALDGVSFSVAPGHVLSLLGPSGCGKSTALRVVAGIEPADAGDVLWDGVSVLRQPPHARGFGLMFQDYALFPHLDVGRNVAFGLRYAGLRDADADARVAELLESVGLAGFERRSVDKLSGGEQQRVALARALAPQPRLLMLDEPLGALDRTLRAHLLPQIVHLLHSLQVPAIYVTHDQDEAFVIGTEVAVMNAGRIERSGPPRDVYRQPGSAFVATFLGLGNLLAGRAESPSHDGTVTAQTSLGTFRASIADEEKVARDADVTVLIRPEAARGARPGETAVTAVVQAVAFHGATQELRARVAGAEFSFVVPTSGDAPDVGAEIQIALGPATATILTNQSSPSARINVDRAGDGDHERTP